MNLQDVRIDGAPDRPKSGMWHTGSNPGWVTATHIPTKISATAYHEHQWKAREAAMMALELMVDDCPVEACSFPESAP